MPSLYTRFKNAIGGSVDYAEIDVGTSSDGIARRVPQSAPSDAAGAPLYPAGVIPALDGTDATGVTPPAGGIGLRGWLSGIYAKLSGTLTVQGTMTVTDGSGPLTVDGSVTVANIPPLVGGKIPVDIGSATVTISGPVTISNEVEVKNDTGSPIPTRMQRGYTPAQAFVSVPAYSSADATTVKLVATITAGMGLLMIDNNGSADAELWFGALPSAMTPALVPAQTPPQGKRVPAGAGVFLDVSMLIGPVYATASSATGLAVVTGA